MASPIAGQETDDQEDQIEELIVNATRLPRAIEDIAATVSVMTTEDMEREMVEDLDDLARFQPGISIRTARRGGHEGFSIRGIGGNRVLTVLDGIRSNDIYKLGFLPHPNVGLWIARQVDLLRAQALDRHFALADDRQ